jgi:hypothetical protein
MTLLIPPISLLLLLAQDTATPIRVDLSTGGWTLGTRPIVSGNKLSALAALTAKEPGDLMLECGSAGAILYTCAHVPCTVPACSTHVDGVAVRRLDTGAAPRDLTSFSTLSGMFTSLRKRDPKSPDTLGVRGGGGVNDAVVFTNAGALHLAPALRRVLEGRHCFRLTRVPPAGPPRTFTLDWDRTVESEGLAQVPNLAPGAYSLEISRANASCEFNDPDSAPAWLVITTQADFARTGEQWKNYTAWLRELEQSGASPAVLLTVRRAILSSLSDTVEKP